MKIKNSLIQLSKEEIAEINEYDMKPGWRIMPQEQTPKVFRGSFKEKTDSVVAITAQTSTGGSYLVYSANRIDIKDKANDIEPFGLIVHSTGASTWGMFIHHGDWVGRTEKPPAGIWDEIERSGIGNYYLSNPSSSKKEGALDELPNGHRKGFDEIVKAIRAQVDKK